MSREPELYKDKIEVSLDGRQIFYLFFGGAVIVGLVFVLGVMVGRRVEARGHVDQARTKTAADPLAALDRLEGSGLSFQTTLTGTQPASEVERTIAEIEKTRADKKPADAVKPAVKPEAAKLEPDHKPDAEKKPYKKPEKPVADKPAEKQTEKQTDKPEKQAEKHDKKPELVDGKPVTKPEHVDDDKKPKKPDAEVAKVEPSAEAKARFTLQLSSFQDKHEAESFLTSVKAAGYQAYVTEADVNGKGTFYRVRLGTYRSLDAANDAKAELEKTLKKSASVMRL